MFGTKLEDSNNSYCHNPSVTDSALSSSKHTPKTVDRHTFGGTSKALVLPRVESLPLLLILAFVSCAKSTAGDGKPNWLLSEVGGGVEEEDDDDDGDAYVPGTSKGGARE